MYCSDSDLVSGSFSGSGGRAIVFHCDCLKN